MIATKFYKNLVSLNITKKIIYYTVSFLLLLCKQTNKKTKNMKIELSLINSRMRLYTGLVKLVNANKKKNAAKKTYKIVWDESKKWKK